MGAASRSLRAHRQRGFVLPSRALKPTAMDTLWTCMAVAGMGALHGLNPASGWLCAAAWGVGSKSRAEALLALAPIALGHLAAMGLVVIAISLEWSVDGRLGQLAAGALLILVAGTWWWGRKRMAWLRAPAGHAGLALGSFVFASAQGAGMMLVPALVPLCAGTAIGQGSGAVELLGAALLAASVHLIAMLCVTGFVGAAVARGIRRLAPASVLAKCLGWLNGTTASRTERHPRSHPSSRRDSSSGRRWLPRRTTSASNGFVHRT
ncbi:membrane hypothetical protein [Burkholderiales bacterium 8X]|nr:membrane hypothetical protein [Burkholderiales bacterium 8X]